MKPITGTANVKLGEVTIARVSLAEAYLASAQGLMRGAQALAASPDGAGMALTLLAGHILECLLKATLLSRGVPEKEVTTCRHRIRELWRRCVALGALPSGPMPPWAERLGALHDKPFVLRYPEGVHGLILPGTQPMVAELQEMLKLACKR